MPHRSPRSLPLGAHEQYQAAAAGDLLQILLGTQEPANRFPHINDVDQILSSVDVRRHLGVPATGAMAKVNPGFHEILNERFRH
jgi:hypothetical protein